MDRDPYLDEVALERIFQDRIVPAELDEPFGARPSRAPYLLIITGQPGSHQAIRAGMAHDEDLAGDNYVDLRDAMSRLRSYHPHYDSLRSPFEPKADLIRAINRSSIWWHGRALDWVKDNSMSLVIDMNPLHVGRIENTAAEFYDDSYRTRLVIAAVPEAISNLMLLERNSILANIRGSRSQLPGPDSEAYDAVGSLVSTAGAWPKMSRITIASREGIVGDQHRALDGIVAGAGSLEPGSRAAREHVFTDAEIVGITNRTLSVTRSLDDRGLLYPQLDQLADSISEKLIPYNLSLADTLGQIKALEAMQPDDPWRRQEFGVSLEPRDPGTEMGI